MNRFWWCGVEVQITNPKFCDIIGLWTVDVIGDFPEDCWYSKIGVVLNLIRTSSKTYFNRFGYKYG